MTKTDIFKQFLQENNFYIDYNGEHYTIINKDNKAVYFTKSTQSLFDYILGYNQATMSLISEIRDLKEANNILYKQNKATIEKYTKIIDGSNNKDIS